MNWLRRFLHRDHLDRHLDAELRDHLERHTHELMRSGLGESEARRQARLDFGGLDQVKEECREVRGTLWLEALRQDVHFAARAYRQSPRFALSAILTIALAVGAATAVFSVVDRSLFRPLPYAQDERLVSIGIVAPVISTQDWLFTGLYQHWARSQTAFDGLAAWIAPRDCDRSDGTPERLACAQVEAGFLPILGVNPAYGRTFAAGEADAALISHRLWQSRFGGQATAVGQRLTLDGVGVRIVGILPPNFETPTLAEADVLLPLKLSVNSQRQRVINVIGRLRSGVTLASARERMAPLFQQFRQSAPADFRQAVPMQLRIATLREHQTRGYRQALWTLLAAVLSFVLIACANVAHLLLARSAARRPEFAIRASLGATRWRLAGQALTESVLLGIAGGALGWTLAAALLRLFQTLAPQGALRMDQASLDLRVLVFAASLSVAAALLFGLAPALQQLRGEALAASRLVGRTRHWLRPALVSVQLTISVVLLTITGLFLQSLWRLQQSGLGFQPEAVVTASFTLPQTRYASDEHQLAFFQNLERKLAELPGAMASAIADSLPPGGDPRSRPFVALTGGGDAEHKGLQGIVKWRYVTRGYFSALGIPILRGRGFTEDDLAKGRQAIILSESLARRLYPKTDPLGRQFTIPEGPAEVVGIAAEVRNSGLRQPTDPEFYALRGLASTGIWRNQRPPVGWRHATAVVRTTLPPGVAIETLAATLRYADPSLAVTTATLNQQMRQYTAGPRFQTALLSLFALIGLVLAAVGLYGLTSFLVAERTREVGVRIALGASPRTIIGMMMKEGLTYTAIGIALGAAASAGAWQFLRAAIAQTEPLDARIALIAVVVLAGVAFMGTWLPSARAARIDPMAALRQE